MWDSMIEKVKKVIYRYEGKQEDEESSLQYSVIYDILIARWTKGNNPLHCLAHSLNLRYYSKKWIKEGPGREPPHKDKEPASSSCCERNWSIYSFVHSVKRNALTLERAENLVFVHSNLRHLSRRTDAYKTGETRMWDVGGDSFDALGGVGILEVADLFLDEPELQAVSYGLDELPVDIVDDNETIEE
ncbi:unnamed protein product [Miscanthus lutarioriparius]|uniref:HAT C-terminal dimerisation domain-containing protein n=1 Tax=Miscanthus lutarioriparius TaxID=422564 RepID=A0A811NEX0_9POAL|nr:unnamed protein product [Miscanthus lutarioriparius]